jgi:2-polyprenyl-6-methoxyphenol hydroxylase-like FAD-dependent oxidoreductase
MTSDRGEIISPVLIVGAGPVGLTMAVELARYGVEVRVIDKSANQTETSRALVVWSRTLELLDRAGCTPAFLEAGLKANGASLRAGKTVLGRPSFDDIASPYNFALMIPQRDTERLLIDHLRALGVEVERQVELVSFSVTDNNEIKARLQHANGQREETTTPWLLGCDGAHSAVRHGVSASFEGSTQDDDWLLADVRLDGEHAPPFGEISIYFHKAGPFVVFPLPGHRARVIGTRGKSDEAHARPDPVLSDVQALIEERAGGGFSASDPAWLANFRINERKVSQYRHGRAFLAGDAAHIHSPAGGQGMNTGMQDAINLAWKLAMVIKSGACDSLLDSYSVERNAVGDMVLRNATALTDMATLTNPAAQTARNLAARFLLGFHAVRHEMAATMSEIDIAYAKSQLSVGRRAGARWDPSLYSGTPPGYGPLPKFILYADNLERAAQVTRQFPNLVESAARSTPDRQIHLIRPDAYVGLTTGTENWDEVETYLKGLQ